jgi:lysozyme
MSKVKIVGSGLAYTVMIIAGWEGLRTVAYVDPVGVPTICYGHTEGVEIGDTATAEECRAQLKDEVQVYWQAVDRLVTVDMRPREHAAFTSFSYNLGIGTFERSAIDDLMNAGDNEAACLEMMKYMKGDRPKRFIEGLFNRRMAEVKLCLGVTAE